MLQWFIRFREFTEFDERSALFRKNSIILIFSKENILISEMLKWKSAMLVFHEQIKVDTVELKNKI